MADVGDTCEAHLPLSEAGDVDSVGTAIGKYSFIRRFYVFAPGGGTHGERML